MHKFNGIFYSYFFRLTLMCLCVGCSQGESISVVSGSLSRLEEGVVSPPVLPSPSPSASPSPSLSAGPLKCAIGGRDPSTAMPSMSCPSGYIEVPALEGYTRRNFCVAKFEMKNDGANHPVSKPDGLPWVSVSRDEARNLCSSLGADYGLISNSQWQTIARNIADTRSNWSNGVAYRGVLNSGYAVIATPFSVPAGADHEACYMTGQICSDTIWNRQRRIHFISNGNVIWDFGGNVPEFVFDDNIDVYLTGYLSKLNSCDNAQKNFGNDQFCLEPSGGAYCGFGYGFLAYNDGGIMRGGGAYGANNDQDPLSPRAGVFAADLSITTTQKIGWAGFRCVYQPAF